MLERGRHAVDLGPSEGLAIRDNGQRFEAGLGEARRAGLVADQGGQPRGAFGQADELPRASDAGQAIAALGRVVFLAQLFQGGQDIVIGGFLEFPGLRRAFLGGSGRSEDVAQFFGAQRFLSREKQRFQYEFQFHFKGHLRPKNQGLGNKSGVCSAGAGEGSGSAGAPGGVSILVMTISPNISACAQRIFLRRVNSRTARKVQTTS